LQFFNECCSTKALIKRVEEVKDELANCRFKLHEVAGKLENATKLVASLRAQNTGLEMDLMKSNEAMSMAKREAQKHSEALKQSLEKINQLGTAFTGAEAKRKAAEAALEKTRLDWEADSKKDRDILWDKLNEKDLLAAQLAAEEAKRTAAEEALKKLQGEFEKAQDALRQAQLYRERVEEDLANATVVCATRSAPVLTRLFPFRRPRSSRTRLPSSRRTPTTSLPRTSRWAAPWRGRSSTASELLPTWPSCSKTRWKSSASCRRPQPS
jgi:DNA repair exonuclease SbcCD ATPase subunit